MNNNTKTYLNILVNEIHSVVMATTDKNGLPSTRVIDIMFYDDKGIYFLTAKGKSFYSQLMDKPYISLSAITSGVNTMARKAISISGYVRNIGIEKLEEIFHKNKYMQEIYPTAESRTALEVFCLYKGHGNFFDLSKKPITRGNFTIGNADLHEFGYFITEDCKSCGICLENCPQQSITADSPYVIIQENCLHCGNCYEVCPNNAIVKRG